MILLSRHANLYNLNKTLMIPSGDKILQVFTVHTAWNLQFCVYSAVCYVYCVPLPKKQNNNTALIQVDTVEINYTALTSGALCLNTHVTILKMSLHSLSQALPVPVSLCNIFFHSSSSFSEEFWLQFSNGLRLLGMKGSIRCHRLGGQIIWDALPWRSPRETC